MNLCLVSRWRLLSANSVLAPGRLFGSGKRVFSSSLKSSQFFERILNTDIGSKFPGSEQECKERMKNLELMGRTNAFLLPEPAPASKQKLLSLVIRAVKNNTFLHITDGDGGIVFTTTAKSSPNIQPGRRGIRDGTISAVERLKNRMDLCIRSDDKKSRRIKAKHDLSKAAMGYHLRLSGLGPGRVPAVYALSASGFRVVKVTDETPLKHAGCRARRPKRC